MRIEVMIKFWRQLTRLFILGVGLLLILLGNDQKVSSSMYAKTFKENAEVFEVLRLHVPEISKEAWLDAEKGSWEPWLSEQDGFLGRQLFWDPGNEEATLLIKWASRPQWKSIPLDEVEIVQKHFEKLAREGTGLKNGNPFPLMFEGELFLQ